MIKFKREIEEKDEILFHYMMVYICEAHASDIWPMKWKIEWESPKNLQQRMKYAKICCDELDLNDTFSTIVIDGMENTFNSDFGTWPTAYYVIGNDAKLLYIGEPQEKATFYDINSLFQFLIQNWKK